MRKTIGTRIVRSILVLLVVIVAVNHLVALLPGDATMLLLGQDATAQQRAQLRQDLGLDKTELQRLGGWFGGILRGDWGTSFASGRPVLHEIASRLPVTLEVVLLGQAVAVILALLIATFSVRHINGAADRTLSGLSFLMLSVPSFVIGLLLIYIFAVTLNVLPASGYVPFAQNPGKNLVTMIMPALTMGLGEAAVYARTLRGSLIATMSQPYMDAAHARGASPWKALWTRALRPSSVSFVTLVGMNIGVSMGGSLIIENIFGIPGIGRLAVTALQGRDIPLLQGIVVFAACAVLIMSMLVDVAAYLINPSGAHE
ncbi:MULTISPECIES: ABC transporter permease [Bifidobacterium]|jgi:peptide/nickel transport system permease protein|uniref:ABC transporter permease n=1 Tax=Bifidobacterium tibiigranuli TaxID=2172043 RepID=A0A5N6S6L7_9BIFI|nr:ABC transporter permease [Bifidobacterium tibiigranuli]KAE8129251.1 ABC transporter permease [Bifidobacterium tibiigranuli]KAE8129489.1 ABC transporter permease [Bifidobacterium tibiigranuli]